MDDSFPEDEYQTLQIFTQEPVESEKLDEIVKVAVKEIPTEQEDLLAIQIILDPDQIQVIQKVFITEPMFVPVAILISVESYLNTEGKERPVVWYAETELRRSLLVEADAQGLGVYYRLIYPNPHFVSQMRVATKNHSQFLPMSCLFLGYKDWSQTGSLQRYESKVKRDQDGVDYWSAGL
ncbi:MAG: hypothetical protein WBI14_10095 [Anaerolineaceae bacterium]